MKGCAIFKVLIINDFKISLLKISVKKNNVLQKPCDSFYSSFRKKYMIWKFTSYYVLRFYSGLGICKLSSKGWKNWVWLPQFQIQLSNLAFTHDHNACFANKAALVITHYCGLGQDCSLFKPVTKVKSRGMVQLDQM